MSPLGVEWGARYELIGPDGTIAVFNDPTSPYYVGVLSPESSGLDSPEVRESAQDATEADGGVHGDFYYGRRPVVLQGTIMATAGGAPSATERNTKVERLLLASDAMRGDATLKWKPVGATEQVELKLRRQQPVRVTKGFVKDFFIPLVAADILPRSTTSTTKSVTIASQTKTSSKLPTSQTQIKFGDGKDGETITWSPTTSGIQAEDGSYTTSEPPSTAGEATSALSLVGSIYGHAVPESATILGVEVQVKRKSKNTNNDIEDFRVQLIRASTPVGNNKAINNGTDKWPTVATVKSYGGKEDLWGTTLTPAQVNAAGANVFGVRFLVDRAEGWAVGDKAEVDSIRQIVYYKEAVAPTNAVTCTNSGTKDADAVITIKGYIENPVIENATTGEKLVLQGTVGEGETLVIDTKNHTIKLNGNYAYKMLDRVNSDWWKLASGASEIKASGDWASATAKLEVKYQSTYF